ncbi:MAG TPA: hypothetical protein DEO33_05025 [Rikenellaceae bacterium]|nr:hypothetical protein [Rikenellaceae bacterium]
MISDKSLYASFLEGDRVSFEELVLRHRHGMVYFLMQYVKSPETAEDLSQEVFAYIFVNPERYCQDYAFKTYLYMLGKRRAIDYIRKETRYEKIPLEESMITDSSSLEESIYRRKDATELRKHILELSIEDQKVITLMDLNGLSIAETAMVMGKSVVSVKVQSHRAKKRLKKIMLNGGFSYEV